MATNQEIKSMMRRLKKLAGGSNTLRKTNYGDANGAGTGDRGTQRMQPRQGAGLPTYSEPTGPRYRFHANNDGAAQPGRPGKNGPGHAPAFNLKPGSRELANTGGHPGNSAVDYDAQIARYQALLDASESNPFMAAEIRTHLAYWSEMKLRFG